MGKLKNKKREMFCQEWIIDLNATQAAKRAGYSEKTVNEQGARLLTCSEVQVRISEIMEERSKRLQITQDRVIEELSVIAFSKITDYLKVEDTEIVIDYEKDEDGNEDRSKPIIKKAKRVTIFDTDSIPKEKLGAIAQIRETREGIAVKLYDKVKALEDLGKHLGMFADKETLELKKKELEMKEGW